MSSEKDASSDTDGLVRAQYEALPYPARDPRDEAKRLIAGSPSHILEIDHYIFAGARDWSLPFRALFAGGGSGDGTVMLAQQLHDAGCPAEIVYLDLSRAARDLAQARLRARGLSNVRLEIGSLTELERLGLGQFDYIDCCGVLHHLHDPAQGMKTLAGALKPEGGMGLMVYGAQGRTGVYPLQEALRQLAPVDLPIAERVKRARRVLAALPPTNWFKRNPHLSDHIEGGDAGLYDLLLHARDRAYDVAGFDALVRGAGLQLLSFIEPARYRVETYVNDPILLKIAAALDPLAQAALAETLAGNITTLAAYVTWPKRASRSVAQSLTASAVPILRDPEMAKTGAVMKPGGAFTAHLGGFVWRAATPNLTGAILARIDGKRSLGEIHAELQGRDGALDWQKFQAIFERVFHLLNGANMLYLRQPRA